MKDLRRYKLQTATGDIINFFILYMYLLNIYMTYAIQNSKGKGIRERKEL